MPQFQETISDELLSDTTKFEEIVQTTFSSQPPDTTTETELVSKTDLTQINEEVEEEEVITETSVAMSIGESEAHKVVMTTIRTEDTTFPENNDQTMVIKDDEVSSIASTSTTTVRTSEGNKKYQKKFLPLEANHSQNCGLPLFILTDSHP